MFMVKFVGKYTSFMDPVDMQQVAIENKETTVIADELLTSCPSFLTTTQKPSKEKQQKSPKDRLKHLNPKGKA